MGCNILDPTGHAKCKEGKQQAFGGDVSETVIKFPSRSESVHVSGSMPTTGVSAPNTSGDTAVEIRQKGVAVITGSAVSRPIEIDKLYPATETTRPDLIRALSILADGIQMLDEARRMVKQRELLESD